ncbi:hypothetical protein [Calothrix sp. 336/3]|uniref:hypothetical protein n=1 Tax=Calothrix sp. 336/3 TaxID=1337936 RepID=UPI0004E2DDB6|nr:hypothetical protein [Calothrix sp. 336/3]AKG23723.1 hypothetical protein IJ00_22695 [Calothrix sp. 336/3]
MLEPLELIAIYDSSLRELIAFNWSEVYAPESSDANIKFRHAVIQAVIANPENVPLELLRDLFDEETRFAAEVGGTNPILRPLTLLMLKAGGSKYLREFLEYRERSMDVACATSEIIFPRELSQQLLQECQIKLAQRNTVCESRLWEQGIKFFHWQLEKHL